MPVKVEYSIASDREEFNVFEQTKILLDLLKTGHTQLCILDADKNVVLLVNGTKIPDREEFIALFKLRQQTFQKGNMTFTIYFVVELQMTIQQLKYMDPIKTFLFEYNIWIQKLPIK